MDPLITQLEKVAEAGIGDVRKVTAAQRTVSAIRVEMTTVAQGLAQAQLDFSNSFGVQSSGIAFDYDFIANLVPYETVIATFRILLCLNLSMLAPIEFGTSESSQGRGGLQRRP